MDIFKTIIKPKGLWLYVVLIVGDLIAGEISYYYDANFNSYELGTVSYYLYKDVIFGGGSLILLLLLLLITLYKLREYGIVALLVIMLSIGWLGRGIWKAGYIIVNSNFSFENSTLSSIWMTPIDYFSDPWIRIGGFLFPIVLWVLFGIISYIILKKKENSTNRH